MDKKVRCWPKTTQQIEFVGNLKNTDGMQPMFFLIITAKIDKKQD